MTGGAEITAALFSLSNSRNQYTISAALLFVLNFYWWLWCLFSCLWLFHFVVLGTEPRPTL